MRSSFCGEMLITPPNSRWASSQELHVMSVCETVQCPYFGPSRLGVHVSLADQVVEPIWINMAVLIVSVTSEM